MTITVDAFTQAPACDETITYTVTDTTNIVDLTSSSDPIAFDVNTMTITIDSSTCTEQTLDIVVTAFVANGVNADFTF